MDVKKQFSNLENKCFISIDEYHRFSNPITNNIFNIISRNIVKNSGYLAISSQLQEDIPKQLNETCTMNIIAREYNKKPMPQFNQVILKGSVLAYDIILNTHNKCYYKTISFKLTPSFLTALSSNFEDIYIREKLSQEFGYLNAIKKMSELNPLGFKRAFSSETEKSNITIEQYSDKLINKIKEDTRIEKKSKII